jgi:ribonuclease HIII
MTVFTHVTKEDIELLLKKGFTKEETKTIHENSRLRKNGVTLVHYHSEKLLLQGKSEDVEKVSSQIHKLKIGGEIQQEKFRKETGWMIGSDESLKGDTFGGIVVAAVKADDEGRKELIGLGVADSKSFADKEIIIMAERVKRVAQCEIKSLLPDEYNKYDGNVTKLLNKLHADAAKYLFPGNHVVDKYPGCNVGNIQVEKAESKYVEVAAASVLARAAALKQLDFLSMQAGFTIPKGSAHVELALHELKQKGLDFSKFVKVDFKNVKGVLEG